MTWTDIAALLVEASEICSPRITARGQSIMLYRLESGGFHTEDCRRAIEGCISVGDIRWHKLIGAVKRLKWARDEEMRRLRKEDERRQEEKFMNADGGTGTAECHQDPRDCGSCAFAEGCGVMRNRFKDALRGVGNQRCSADEALYHLAREFPGAGFEAYGSAEYEAKYGDSCYECGAPPVRRYDQLRCASCDTWLSRVS